MYVEIHSFTGLKQNKRYHVWDRNLLLRKIFFQSMTQVTGKKKNPSTLSRRRTCDLLVTSPDAQSPSYRRLVGAKATLLLLDYGQSLFFLGPASKTRETGK